MTYHNTTNLRGRELDKAVAKAESQNIVVMSLFILERQASPSQIYRMLLPVSPETPITSIRRSITNLTRAGRLVRTEEKVEGMYGRPEYVWKLAKNQLTLF